MLLPSMVYREIPREAHRELLRAQAILVRSRVCRSLRSRRPWPICCGRM